MKIPNSNQEKKLYPFFSANSVQLNKIGVVSVTKRFTCFPNNLLTKYFEPSYTFKVTHKPGTLLKVFAVKHLSTNTELHLRSHSLETFPMQTREKILSLVLHHICGDWRFYVGQRHSYQTIRKYNGAKITSRTVKAQLPACRESPSSSLESCPPHTLTTHRSLQCLILCQRRPSLPSLKKRGKRDRK